MSSVKNKNNSSNKIEDKMSIKLSNPKSKMESNSNINNDKNINNISNYKNFKKEEKDLLKKQTELLSQIKALEEKLAFEKEQHQYLIESKQEEIEYKTK